MVSASGFDPRRLPPGPTLLTKPLRPYQPTVLLPSSRPLTLTPPRLLPMVFCCQGNTLSWGKAEMPTVLPPSHVSLDLPVLEPRNCRLAVSPT